MTDQNLQKNQLIANLTLPVTSGGYRKKYLAFLLEIVAPRNAVNKNGRLGPPEASGTYPRGSGGPCSFSRGVLMISGR